MPASELLLTHCFQLCLQTDLLIVFQNFTSATVSIPSVTLQELANVQKDDLRDSVVNRLVQEFCVCITPSQSDSCTVVSGHWLRIQALCNHINQQLHGTSLSLSLESQATSSIKRSSFAFTDEFGDMKEHTVLLQEGKCHQQTPSSGKPDANQQVTMEVAEDTHQDEGRLYSNLTGFTERQPSVEFQVFTLFMKYFDVINGGVESTKQQFEVTVQYNEASAGKATVYVCGNSLEQVEKAKQYITSAVEEISKQEAKNVSVREFPPDTVHEIIVKLRSKFPNTVIHYNQEDRHIELCGSKLVTCESAILSALPPATPPEETSVMMDTSLWTYMGLVPRHKRDATDGCKVQLIPKSQGSTTKVIITGQRNTDVLRACTNLKGVVKHLESSLKSEIVFPGQAKVSVDSLQPEFENVVLSDDRGSSIKVFGLPTDVKNAKRKLEDMFMKQSEGDATFLNSWGHSSLGGSSTERQKPDYLWCSGENTMKHFVNHRSSEQQGTRNRQASTPNTSSRSEMSGVTKVASQQDEGRLYSNLTCFTKGQPSVEFQVFTLFMKYFDVVNGGVEFTNQQFDVTVQYNNASAGKATVYVCGDSLEQVEKAKQYITSAVKEISTQEAKNVSVRKFPPDTVHEIIAKLRPKFPNTAMHYNQEVKFVELCGLKVETCETAILSALAHATPPEEMSVIIDTSLWTYMGLVLRHKFDATAGCDVLLIPKSQGSVTKVIITGQRNTDVQRACTKLKDAVKHLESSLKFEYVFRGQAKVSVDSLQPEFENVVLSDRGSSIKVFGSPTEVKSAKRKLEDMFMKQ